MSIHIIEILTCTQYSLHVTKFINPVVISSIQIGAVHVLKVPIDRKGDEKSDQLTVLQLATANVFSTCYPRFPVHNGSQLIVKER